VLIYEFKCWAFYFVHESELYVVVVNFLVSLKILIAMDNCLRLIVMLFIVIPILWITKEIMSRGPQVADMECRETT
jgi:hypothetical protein